MALTLRTKAFSQALLLGAAALGLSACGSSDEPTYEADVTDESGGDMVVDDAAQEGVDVELPETPMTSVPPESETPPAAE